MGENTTTVIPTLIQPNKNSKQLTVSFEEPTATLMPMEFFKQSIMYLMPKGSKLLPLTCHKHLLLHLLQVKLIFGMKEIFLIFASKFFCNYKTTKSNCQTKNMKLPSSIKLQYASVTTNN